MGGGKWHFSIEYCVNCGFVQISNPLNKEEIYQNYLTPSSWKNQPHIDDELMLLENEVDGRLKSILEIGCNDGSYLEYLIKKFNPQYHMGIEPCLDVYSIAKEKNMNIVKAFFGEEYTKNISKIISCFDLIVTRHVFEHIFDMHDFLYGVKKLMSNNSIFMIEIPVCETQFASGDLSFVWEEHVNYFTENTIEMLLCMHGFRIIKKKSYVFSGNAFVLLCQKDDGDIPFFDESRRDFDLNLISSFSDRLTKRVESIIDQCKKVHAMNKKVVAYGCGHGVIDYLNIFLDQYVDYVVDDCEEKQNKFLPGCAKRVYSFSKLCSLVESTNEEVGLVLLGVYYENENKIAARCIEKFGRSVLLLSLYTPTHFE